MGFTDKGKLLLLLRVNLFQIVTFGLIALLTGLQVGDSYLISKNGEKLSWLSALIYLIMLVLVFAECFYRRVRSSQIIAVFMILISGISFVYLIIDLTAHYPELSLPIAVYFGCLVAGNLMMLFAFALGHYIKHNVTSTVFINYTFQVLIGLGVPIIFGFRNTNIIFWQWIIIAALCISFQCFIVYLNIAIVKDDHWFAPKIRPYETYAIAYLMFVEITFIALIAFLFILYVILQAQSGGGSSGGSDGCLGGTSSGSSGSGGGGSYTVISQPYYYPTPCYSPVMVADNSSSCCCCVSPLNAHYEADELDRKSLIDNQNGTFKGQNNQGYYVQQAKQEPQSVGYSMSPNTYQAPPYNVI